MRHRLGNGKHVDVVRRRVSSDADGHADLNAGELAVASSIRKGSRKELEILLHELLHLERWSLAEATVDRYAKSAARLLWAQGWRKSE